MVSESDYRRGRSVVNAMHVHLVFVTKYRHGVFTNAMLSYCEQVMRDVCADFESELAEFNGEADHVHLLVNFPPKVAVSKLVNSLKGVSSRRLRHEFTGRVNKFSMNGQLWSPSYLAASCGEAPLSIVRQYIEQQQHPPRGPGRPRN